MFRTPLGDAVFKQKYALAPEQTWLDKAFDLSDIVWNAYQHEQPYAGWRDDAAHIKYAVRKAIETMKFIPGGRYIYYAGRDAHFYNNCFLFKSKEDTRQAWADLMYSVTSSLMSGGGIGDDYSVFRPKGSKLNRTGGQASGPIPLMYMVNETGRNVMQGGSRRSAMYASLNWQHGDIQTFIHAKDWEDQLIKGAFDIHGNPFTVKMAKEADFNYSAPLDMTNISVNYDDAWLNTVGRDRHPTFIKNVQQAMRNGEPGFSFNFGDKQNETARNACTEVTSEDDGDVCNLGSINMAEVNTIEEFAELVRLGTIFLFCGTIVGELPLKQIEVIREKNRRLGLGLMGVHEWLLKRGYGYEVTPELHEWLAVYKTVSDETAAEMAINFNLSKPVAVRAIAPTGTIGIIAGTTTGIEPIYAVAYKRRFLVGGDTWHYQYCIDSTAQAVIDATGCDPDSIETALTLAQNPKKRIKFQADVQDYVDMAISSTLNLPSWGTEFNNIDRVQEMATILSEYAPRLRGLTFYPDGARGGQPITQVPYAEAIGLTGVTFEENDSCKGGVCGL